MNPATKKQKTSLPDDGERMVPSHHKGKLMYAEHITRYQAALEFVKGKTVLDIASGSGYGTKILSSSAKKVFGVDVSTEAITYAKKQYSGSNITYLLGDGQSIPLPDGSVDVVITYETIEHIKDYRKFLDEVSRVLKKDGVAIVSTPNDLEFAEGNHFHLHEFKESELAGLLQKKFKYIDKYYQATWKSVGIGTSKLFSEEGSIDADLENMSHINPSDYLYFFFVCSNQKISQSVRSTIAIGEHYSDRKVTDTNNELIRLNGLLLQYEQQMIILNSEKSTLASELYRLHESRSWKLTRPLRYLSRRVRG